MPTMTPLDPSSRPGAPSHFEGLDASADALRDAMDQMRVAQERADELAALLATDALTPDLLLQLAQSRLRDLDAQVAQLMDVMNDATLAAQRIGAHIMGLRDVMTSLEPLYDGHGNLNPDAPMPGREVQQTFSEALDVLVRDGHISEEAAELLRSGTDAQIRAAGGDPELRAAVDNARAHLEGWGFRGPVSTMRDHVRTIPVTVREHIASLAASGQLTADEANAVLAGRDGLSTLIDRANDELRQVNSGSEMNMIRLQSVMQQRTSIISATTNLLKSMDEGNDAVIANLR
jgi:hypothetical protein